MADSAPTFALFVLMSRIRLSGVVAALCGLLPFCQHSHHHSAQEHMHKTDFEELVRRFESEERDAYQKPEKVMQHLDNIFKKRGTSTPNFAKGWSGLKVADLGAGTGYFSFRMAREGASVLALDIDERFLEYIESHENYAKYRGQVKTRRVDPDSIGLKPGEVDVIFSTNVYHHIDNRVDYFREARRGLTENGILVIIDFKQGDMPVGPPEHIKLSEDQVRQELSDAGYEVEVDHLLTYQNIYIASKD